MAGRGVPDTQAGAAHSRVFKWTCENRCVPAIDPLHWDKPEAEVGYDAHHRIAMMMPRVFFVSSEGLDSMGDGLHFNKESQRNLAKRYAATYLAIRSSAAFESAIDGKVESR